MVLKTVLVCCCFMLILPLIINFPVPNTWPTNKNPVSFENSLNQHVNDQRKVKLVSTYKGTLSGINISDFIGWNHSILESVTEPTCVHNSLIAIIITSAPDHQEQRNEIRETWCSRNPRSMLYESGYVNDVFCVFLLGKSSLSSVNGAVASEVERYQDILLAGYEDVYRNLTLKVLTGLNWIHNKCSSKFVLKTDDDCFVNTFILPKVLAENYEASSSHLYTGYLYRTPKETKVIRSKANKWHVSEDEVLPDYYPPYISGTGYILSSYSLKVIMKLARSFKPFPNEDAYVGMLVERAGLEPKASYRFVLTVFGWTTCNFLYLIVVHNIRPSQMSSLRDQVFKATEDCHEEINTVLWNMHSMHHMQMKVNEVLCMFAHKITFAFSVVSLKSLDSHQSTVCTGFIHLISLFVRFIKLKIF